MSPATFFSGGVCWRCLFGVYMLPGTGVRQNRGAVLVCPYDPLAYSSLLDLIRFQRHDFLNHLQVISGFLQLGKVDRAADYINQLSAEIQETGKLMRLGRPELVAAIMSLAREAERAQIRLVPRIQTQKGSLTGASSLVTNLICKVAVLLFDFLRSLASGPKLVELTISDLEDAFKISFVILHTDQQGNTFDFAGMQRECQPLLEQCRASLRNQVQGDRLEIELLFPGC